ncbi:hypothetical protein DIURU_003036 [Diutina rugosa]|uniref:Auxin efflux carrier n=1 Tax=Diutina rugosa TaxID=5481 RepID=A0A642UN08_DIURU|nr:uncharacterized protein DIURU_003036 [Diutina rugosa]KAA8901985.1 hypothetical protein DIURU_003036 [Diutina rugosa]
MSLYIGTIIYVAVKPMFKIYFILALGFYLAKRNILTVSTCRDISDMVVTAVMPCLILNNLISNLKSSDIKQIGIVFFTALCLFTVGLVLAAFTYFLTKSPRRWLGGLLSVGLFPNISDMPIAYLQTMSKGGVVISEAEGNRGIAFVCIYVAAQICLQFSLGLFRLVEYDFKRDKRLNLVHVHDDSSDEKKDDAHSVASSDHTPSLASSSVSIAPSQTSSAQHEQFIQHRRSCEQPMQTNLQMIPSRTVSERHHRTEDIETVINEYSEYSGHHHDVNDPADNISAMSTVDQPKLPLKQRLWSGFKNWCITMSKNLRTPNSMALIAGIAISMAPPLKALFVPVEHPHIPTAPDHQPPLSFVMDIVSYIGAASVPLGLLLLGATISRLQVKKMPKGFWKTAVGITVSRLVVLPIFGVGLTTGLVHGGWYGKQDLLRFVSVIEFGMPSATILVFFTAFYTDPNSEDHLQMDCLAVCLIFQYAIFWVTLPFLVTFTFKVSMGR